eukprot:TRINITY_DN1049_c0_g1_i5.p1 TRINITY_DN1049_c0_g1~~TRINITY_DN1049_c0_g1_i5.p1  ORF type:complete len:830 (-),score=95.28 TRINITY_DN1049_c0_g1_i5:72-2561(-)
MVDIIGEEERTSLLQHSFTQDEEEYQLQSQQQQKKKKEHRKDKVKGFGVDLLFLKRLWRILLLLRAYHIAFVGILSFGEAYFISLVGKLQGQFYELYLRDDRGAFGQTVATSMATYLGAVACSSTAKWLSQLLAVKWRKTLGRHMHKLYCTNMRFYWLKYRRGEYSIDNPDQRLTDDLKQLCSVLGSLTYSLSAVPFNLILYIYLVVHVYSIWTPVFIAAGFCLVGLFLQRTLMTKLARLVFIQEKLEGDFRKGHMRMRDEGESVAMYQEWKPELEHLDGLLQYTLSNQYRIVMWTWLLIALTKMLEYTGSTLNYVCIALAVFGGVWSTFDSAELAQKISNASFYTLTLIYTFTLFLDAADKISKMAGLLHRVCQLLEELETMDNQGTQLQMDPSSQLDYDRRNQEVINQDGRPAWHYKTQALELMPPFIAWWNSSQQCGEVEISVHCLGQDVLLQEVLKCFPDAPSNTGLLAIVTMQFGPVQEMDEMFQVFLEWESAISLALDKFWVDGVNPKNGLALNGKKGKRYSEVFAAQVLLGYPKVKTEGCDMLEHPIYGSNVYPATIFTNAPLSILKRILSATHELQPRTPGRLQTHVGSSDQALVIEDICLRTPSSKLVLQNLSLSLPRGSSLLITGPSGCGKTTFVKALCGLWHFEQGRALLLPCQAGSQMVSCSNNDNVLFLPQNPIVAPSGSLKAQLVYPSSDITNADNVVLKRLLKIVHLEYLIEQIEDFEIERDWAGFLSPGELQKLSIARVLYHKPLVVVADEATSALPELTENQLISKIQAEGITIICVGHRSSLERYFDRKLVIQGDGLGSWSVDESIEYCCS